MDYSLFVAKQLVLFNEAVSHARQGHPRQMGHSEEFWQNTVHLLWRKKWQPSPGFLPGEPHGQGKKKDMMLENKHPLPPGWKVSIMLLRRTDSNSNRSSKNETAGPKWEWCSAVGVSGGESKAWCCKEQYCIETWNFRSMNQAKLDVVKQEMARLNINILGIGELQNGQEWENLIQMTIVSTTVGKNALEEIE